MSRAQDYDDNFEFGPARGEETGSSAGMIGFIFAVVSIGLFVVVGVLWYFLDDDQARMQNQSQKRWMLYWFLFLDVVSFFAALAATVLGGRGLSPSNSHYRGFSLAALICGLIEIILTLVFGVILTCFVMIFEAFAGR
jgi:hypothetical protein